MMALNALFIYFCFESVHDNHCELIKKMGGAFISSLTLLVSLYCNLKLAVVSWPIILEILKIRQTLVGESEI
jgi:hypothetical protein